MPNFVGMTIGDVKRSALQSGAQLNMEVVGSGKYVILQSPPGGTQVAANSTVRIYLGDTSPNPQAN
ncbi:hypothetical protein GCM10025857_05310 [Alicyclobacillus contaminans]|nr:hypothetical protein GCM10025857_05310 [Alicyclobacillus contaminans]